MQVESSRFSFRRLRNWFLVLMIGGGVLSCAMYLALVFAILDERYHATPNEVCCETPADWGFADYEDVAFTGGDGLTLRGWYIPSQNGAAIIALHSYGGNRLVIADVAQMLANAGYGVLMYDLRAHGESDGDLRSFGWLDVRDVPGAVAYLQNRPEVDPEKIGIFGHSIGGQIALQAASVMPELKAVVADGPAMVNATDVGRRDGFKHRVVAYLHNLVTDQISSVWLDTDIPVGITDLIGTIAPRPVLLIAGGDDHGEVSRLETIYRYAGEPVDMIVIEGAGHGEGWIVDPERYRENMLVVFDAALLRD